METLTREVTEVENALLNERQWTAAELRKAPAEVRDAVLRAAAALAEADYRHDPELTAFEAFGENDLYGDSAQSETR